MEKSWYQTERGIHQTTLDAFGVEEKHGEIFYPYPTGIKVRYEVDGKRQFRFVEGNANSLFTSPDGTDANVAFLCEGETDAMRLWQEFEGRYTVYGLGGINTWRPHFADYFKKHGKVYCILDNDPDYKVAQVVNDTYRKIRTDVGVKARRVSLPDGIKDVCEFFQAGHDIETLRLLTSKGTNVSRFDPLDLTKEPPPVRWLMDGFIALGDVTLVSGPSGVGKSWITMGLTQAVADGTEMFLGRTIYQGGRVLYFDEENPEDVVYSRLRKLGLSHPQNVRYIWNNGVRIDQVSDVVLDEALDFKPTLIVLDSLTRIHSGEENSVGDMAPLLNDCIRPLARETGAAVVLIHHHDKGGNGPRGSADILASVDGALDATTSGEGLVLKLTKSRRRMSGLESFIKIQDTETGVELHTHERVEPRF